MTEVMRYICLDLETTALEPTEGQILQIGIVLEGSWLAVNELPTFKRLVVPSDGKIYGDPIAISMNMNLIAEVAALKKLGFPKKGPDWHGSEWCYDTQLEDEVISFLKIQMGLGKHTYGGKNIGGFDLDWIEEHFPRILAGFRPHHRVIDPACCYHDVDIDGNTPPSLATCKERAGLEPIVFHDALADAFDVIRVYREIKGIPEEGKPRPQAEIDAEAA